jgi:hypothetical protein
MGHNAMHADTTGNPRPTPTPMEASDDEHPYTTACSCGERRERNDTARTVRATLQTATEIGVAIQRRGKPVMLVYKAL